MNGCVGFMFLIVYANIFASFIWLFIKDAAE